MVFPDKDTALVIKSKKPVGIMIMRLACDQGNRCRDKFLTEIFLDKPKSLKSNITAAPTKKTNPII